MQYHLLTLQGTRLLQARNYLAEFLGVKRVEVLNPLSSYRDAEQLLKKLADTPRSAAWRGLADDWGLLPHACYVHET